MKAAAFRATIHGLKTVPTRKVCQLTVEFPIEDLPRVAAIAEHGAWVGIARLEEPSKEAEAVAEKAPRPWSALSYAAQAGIRCGEPLFQAFVREQKKWHKDDGSIDEYVRSFCDVESRRDIRHGTPAERRWVLLENEFTAWKAADRVGAI